MPVAGEACPVSRGSVLPAAVSGQYVVAAIRRVALHRLHMTIRKADVAHAVVTVGEFVGAVANRAPVPLAALCVAVIALEDHHGQRGVLCLCQRYGILATIDGIASQGIDALIIPTEPAPAQVAGHGIRTPDCAPA